MEDVEGQVNGVEEDPEAEEKKFEQEHEDQIRHALESKRHVHGGIAEYGIIESIQMVQFMCHRFLKFDFGNRMNFIIGHNGSGKSAVLSAITVALGGKATSTGRGSGLKSFIREGQSIAEVTISIKNHGDEAYKPQEYGKSIIITRRFTKDGLSSWKIKSKDGRVISTKREELASICDHMNIQVDNPLNVLTQDSARQFLSASNPADKYKFFLKGTQLAHLSDEYDICLENVRQTNKILARKREALPDLRNAFREATVRYEEAEKAREQKRRADDLKKELAWAHIRSKEEEVTQKLEDLAKAQRKLPKIETELEAAKAKFDAATEEVATFEQEHNALGDIDDLNEERDKIKSVLRENRKRIQDINTDLKAMDDNSSTYRTQIEDFGNRIAVETARMEESNQAKREERQRQIEAARQAVTDAEARMNGHINQIQELGRANSALRSSGEGEDKRKNELKDQIARTEHLLSECKQQDNNKYVSYGRNIKEVVERIKLMKWYGEMPIGPLGVNVRAKDPSKWGVLLRNMLAQHLTAYSVSDARDRIALKKLLNETGNSHITIIIHERDLFDYHSGEPPENVLTVLRALEISDPHVLRILINVAHIERILLADTRKEGDFKLRELRGGTAWTNDGFLVRVYPEGGVSSTKLELRKELLRLLLTERDTITQSKHLTEELRKLEVEYNALNTSVGQKKKEYNEREATILRLRQEHRRAEETFRNARYNLNTLQQEANNDLPANISALEEAKQSAEQELQTIRVQFEEVARGKFALDATNRELLTQSGELKRRIDEFMEQQKEVRNKVEDAAAKRVVAKKNVNHYEKKLKDEQEKVNGVEQAAEVVQQELINWTEKALEFCERWPNPRTVAEVQRNLDSVQRALQERARRQGATVEEMVIEVNRAKAKLEAIERELKQMASLNRALKKSLTLRLARWQEFRRHIALRCKLIFQFNMSHRGYFGKILFDHERQSLQLKVQTDDQIATQGTRDKDPRSLSGGEKSFSTICLLLALWESIGCPLRCLDEFDVFMDAINRRVSMKMLIEMANSSDKKQYILITPQDMTNITPGNAVRVHRMSDPERGQGVLQFGS
ncbi:hypothetical protein AMATHDRAFT_59575 [Amanita thiersii Skay4041]|uniref:RecF/RecN/SMC N-terminal domain-containing protein n=1 Tax=Amanita thiersii Skay4041 TaxID=703135 RepID=A0A2A9NUB3_9AGAR|nr:hypothetical protein AMATHDRAFT_59575 [Amanita thiersii Skay4041]